MEHDSLNLIQKRIGIEVGQRTSVAPGIGFIVVDRKGVKVAHVLDFLGQGSRKLVLRKLWRPIQ